MDVLIAGAGPVGLYHALEFTKRGLEVRVFDEEWKAAARSYALALHPRTLEVIQRSGLMESLAPRGRSLDGVRFYDAEAHRATIDFSMLGSPHDRVLVVAQGDLESAIENRLKDAGVLVRWNHRLTSVSTRNAMPRVTVGRLGPNFRGGGPTTSEWSIEDEVELRPHFVVGADGRESFVRRSLEIPWETAGEPAYYAVFEFRTSEPVPPQVHVVLDEHGTSVLWPLPGNRGRWSFALSRPDDLTAWQSKARLAIARENRETLPSDEGLFERLCRERAPWFDMSVSDVDWFSVVRFDDGLAREFGRDHIWLAGDAAHRTTPIPVHGLNVSLLDAPEFAEHIEGVLTDRASLEDLVRLGETRRARWLAMIDPHRQVRTSASTDDWVRRNATRIAESVPAARADLATLVGQIGIEIEPAS
jgi:2-polyprenyl-6-methoxyphenol hydroxylase-like FAD-dependent oxidoreductase